MSLIQVCHDRIEKLKLSEVIATSGVTLVALTALAAGVCTLLALEGVPLGPFNALGGAGLGGGISLTSTGALGFLVSTGILGTYLRGSRLPSSAPASGAAPLEPESEPRLASAAAVASSSARGSEEEVEVVLPAFGSGQELSKQFRLPLYCYSKIGTLSTDHFLYWLSQQPPAERDAKLKWMFTQRKFTVRVPDNSTVGGTRSIGGDPLVRMNVEREFHKDLWKDQDGYAASVSNHAVVMGHLVSNDAILGVEEVVEVIDRGDNIFMGKYADGKHIIQQVAPRGCGETCVAMLRIDRSISVSNTYFINGNLSTSDRLEPALKRIGTVTNKVVGKKGNLDSIKTPALATINSSIGGHAIIVDEVRNDRVVIRDPWHGWRIHVKREMVNISTDFMITSVLEISD